MSSQFYGEGNLGKDPVMKYTTVRGEQRTVTEFSVRIDKPVFDDQGNVREDRGFWLRVAVWGKRGEMAAKLLRKGARIHVGGTLGQHEWTDKESGEELSMLQLNADHWAIDPICLDSVQYAARRGDTAREELMESEREGVTA